MRKKLFQWAKKAGTWLFTKIFGAALTTGVAVTITVFLRSLWEELTWTQRAVVSIGGFAFGVWLVRELWRLADFLIDKYTRSFKVEILPPHQVSNGEQVEGYWHRLAVSSTDKNAEIKTLKCQVGDIIPWGWQCDPELATRLSSLRHNLGRERYRNEIHQPQTHHLSPGELAEFDFFLTRGNHWDLCIARHVSGSLPIGKYVIRVDVFGDESKPVNEWLVAMPFDGQLVLRKAPPGFDPKQPLKELARLEALEKRETNVQGLLKRTQ